MSKIYTKKGDQGNTKTLRGPISKGDQLAIALGTLDELNSWIGLCRYTSPLTPLLSKERDGKKRGVDIEMELARIQNNLLNIGSGLAGSAKRLQSRETRRLEKIIDKLTVELPELTHFVFPVGYLQVARTVARRAEREVVKTEVAVKPTLKYLNRLSDALFTMARWVNMKQGIEEEVWK